MNYYFDNLRLVEMLLFIFELCVQRLAPVKEKLGASATWEEIVNAAYFERISLSATGFHKTCDLGNR